MKIKRAIKAAVNWSGGDQAKAAEIFNKQRNLDPALDEQFTDEAADAYIEKLIEEFLSKGYSLSRPEELIVAVGERLKNGPADTETP